MEVHFIAIGGSVMHQLAIALKQKGYLVTGSDDEIFEPAQSNLLKEGLLPSEMGWFPEKIHKSLDAIILGMHARNDNPELLKARELGIQIFSFPEYIYQESKNKTRVVVGGSHGKTTTTAMIMHILRSIGNDFDYLVGARLDGFDNSVKITSAPLIVCEGDEYPASTLEKRPKFHFLFPNIAVLTGIAWDHINVFPTFENYLEQFQIFIRKIEPNGVLIYNETDPTLKELVESGQREDIRYVPYGIPQHRITNGKTEAHFGDHAALLQVFGDHNLMNMNAAYLACKELEVSSSEFCQHISTFKGAAKRLELLASNENLSIFRDFAHAPSKLKATINAVKQQFPDRKLVAVFELHTYSSLNEQFMKEYAGSMDQADQAVVYYSKHALEIKRLPDLSPDKIREGFGKPGLEVINDPASLMDWLHQVNYRNTNLLLMSSGNYDGSDMLNFAERAVR